MAEQLGVSFAPTFENADLGKRTGTPSSGPLQVLSYRIPKFRGAGGGLSPLQGDERAGSSVGRAVLESVFRTVLGSEADAFLASMSGGGGGSSFGQPARDPAADFWGNFASQFGGGFAPPPVVRPGNTAPVDRQPAPTAPPPAPGPSFADPAPTMDPMMDARRRMNIPGPIGPMFDTY